MATSVKTHVEKHVALAASTAYGNSFDAIYVGVTGDITVTINGVSVAYTNVPVGINPISGNAITAATTADEMVVLNW